MRALLVLALSGCLSVPDGGKKQCNTSSDCDTANGEVCDENVCWGNPPGGAFAAIVSPPSKRADELVTRELPELMMPADGWVGDIALDEPVAFTGAVHPSCPEPLDCSTRAFGATVVLTRASRFVGGPGVSVSAKTDPETGKFQLNVPRTTASDEPYQLTVIPEGRDKEPNDDTIAAQLVPPMHTKVSIAANVANKTLEIGGLTLAKIDGAIVDTVTSNGPKQYRVVALGRWDPDARPVEVSTVHYTGSDGSFSLRISKDVVGPVEIVATPYGVNAHLPTLHMSNVQVGSTSRELVVPNGLGTGRTVVFTVEGVDASGGVSPIAGARVVVSGLVAAAAPSTSRAVLVNEGTTDPDGTVSVPVLDGNAIRSTYTVSVIPPPNAIVGTLFGETLELGAQEPEMKTLRLPDRVALRGVVRDVDGEPLQDVAVTVRPSLRFAWSLEPEAQAFLAAVPAATTVTPSTGEFVAWVDPLVADVWGYYDLAYEPVSASDTLQLAPSWVSPEIEIPRNTSQTTVTLEDVRLPEAAHIHGRVTDPGGNSIDDAELKIFRVDADRSLCEQVRYEPTSCPIPALLVGRGASDSDGTVRLTLPR